MKPRILLLSLLSVLVPMATRADEPPTEPLATVAAFHEALAAQDQKVVIALLSPEVLIFESGGAELSRAEYASHHLGADMEFSAATVRKVTDQETGQKEALAWVLTRSQTTGSFRGKEIDAKGVETMLLKHTPDGWRIFHIHWSSRSTTSN